MMWIPITVLALCLILCVVWLNGLTLRVDEHERRIEKQETRR